MGHFERHKGSTIPLCERIHDIAHKPNLQIVMKVILQAFEI